MKGIIANIAAAPDSNEDSLEQAGKSLDETENIINDSNLLERRAQLESIINKIWPATNG